MAGVVAGVVPGVVAGVVSSELALVSLTAVVVPALEVTAPPVVPPVEFEPEPESPHALSARTKHPAAARAARRLTVERIGVTSMVTRRVFPSEPVANLCIHREVTVNNLTRSGGPNQGVERLPQYLSLRSIANPARCANRESAP